LQDMNDILYRFIALEETRR